MLKKWGILFVCEKCGAMMNIPSKALDKRVTCPCCKLESRFPCDFSFEKIIYVGSSVEHEINVTFQ